MNYEKSLITKFRKEIFRPFREALEKYSLINEGDKILVCLSGGKDSFLMALLLRYIQKYGNINFSLEYILMNPGYLDDDLNEILANFKLINLDVKVYDKEIFKITNLIHPKNPCYMCAKMRRGSLYAIGQELGCNKIALGHNFDDVIETIMMNMLFNGTYSGMLPKLNSKNFSNMELIRPLYLIREDNIVKWSEDSKLKFPNCKCLLASKEDSKRHDMKLLIKELDSKYQYASRNIFNTLENVNPNTILGYINDLDK